MHALLNVIKCLVLIPISICSFCSLNAQCDFELSYSGLPGEVYSDSFPVLPGEIIQIDYCTNNVPDELVIENPFETLHFFVGSAILATDPPPRYHGYVQAVYQNAGLNIELQNAWQIPSDIGCDPTTMIPGGIFRLTYHVPAGQCLFKYSVLGNKLQFTVYHLCLKILQTGTPIETDTIYYPVCGNFGTNRIISNCRSQVIIPVNREIETKINVIQNKCLGTDEASIEFDNYPEFNQYNLDSGLVNIRIDNGVCFKDFSIEIENGQPCQFYIPNIFSPNWDGQNDDFIFFTAEGIEYEMRIYDRWGSLIFKGTQYSNISGWDGTDGDRECAQGVYVYMIRCSGQQFSGNVTIIR